MWNGGVLKYTKESYPLYQDDEWYITCTVEREVVSGKVHKVVISRRKQTTKQKWEAEFGQAFPDDTGIVFECPVLNTFLQEHGYTVSKEAVYGMVVGIKPKTPLINEGIIRQYLRSYDEICHDGECYTEISGSSNPCVLRKETKGKQGIILACDTDAWFIVYRINTSHTTGEIAKMTLVKIPAISKKAWLDSNEIEQMPPHETPYYDFTVLRDMLKQNGCRPDDGRIKRLFDRMYAGQWYTINNVIQLYNGEDGAATKAWGAHYNRDDVPMKNFLITVDPLSVIFKNDVLDHFTVMMLLSSLYSIEDQHYIIEKNMKYFTGKASRAVMRWAKMKMTKDEIAAGFDIADVKLYPNNILRYIIKPKAEIRKRDVG